MQTVGVLCATLPEWAERAHEYCSFTLASTYLSYKVDYVLILVIQALTELTIHTGKSKQRTKRG